MKNWPYPSVLAHRCGGLLAPENTLIGLNQSAALGCRGVEFDVMLNRDESAFVIHDETLDRTTTAKGAVDQASDADLTGCDAGSYFDPRFAGEPVPRFRHVAARCVALGLVANVEIKPAEGHAQRTGQRVASEAAQFFGVTAVPPLLSSFSEEALAAARRAAPALPRGLLFEIPPSDWRARCERLGTVSMHVEAAAVDVGLVTAARAAHLWLVVYTVNDPNHARALMDLGVDCIITDRPDLVRESC